MSNKLSISILALVPLVPAFAAAAPLAGAQHDPPLVYDVTASRINIVSRNDDGYGAQLSFVVGGANSSKDKLRFEWRSGKKVVGSGSCGSAAFDPSDHTLAADCELDKNVKATGPIEVDVILKDDRDDKEYRVATLKTAVRNWKGIGKTQYWGHVPDDLLGAAFVRYGSTNDDLEKTYRTPWFVFWSTNGGLTGAATMRCTVDGAKQADFDASLDAMPHMAFASSFTNAKEQRTYEYEQYRLEPGFHYGNKADSKRRAATNRWLMDAPGKWACALRANGKTIRTFEFVVDAAGMIAQSAMQSGKGAIATLPSTVLIDMAIPKDNGVEKRVRPDAMKKSLWFGIPWPEAPRVQEIQAAFPPASGLAD